MNNDYKITNEYDHVLADLLQTEEELDYISECGVSVGIVASSQKKKKGNMLVHADCRKVQDIYKLYCPYDFIITVYERNILYFTDEQIRILLFHELLHIQVSGSGDDLKLSVKDHDINDFALIYKRYGLDWSRTSIA